MLNFECDSLQQITQQSTIMDFKDAEIDRKLEEHNNNIMGLEFARNTLLKIKQSAIKPATSIQEAEMLIRDLTQQFLKLRAMEEQISSIQAGDQSRLESKIIQGESKVDHRDLSDQFEDENSDFQLRNQFLAQNFKQDPIHVQISQQENAHDLEAEVIVDEAAQSNDDNPDGINLVLSYFNKPLDSLVIQRRVTYNQRRARNIERDNEQMYGSRQRCMCCCRCFCSCQN